MDQPTARRIVVGRIADVYGIRGWLKVQSFTEPPAEILDYSPWMVGQGSGWQTFAPDQGKAHGKGVVVHLAGCDDRDSAAALKGAEIAIRREQFPVLPEGEYYWTDLEGMEVATGSGVILGRVARLFDTGGNVVMVVRGEREHLIPFVRNDVVLDVNQDNGVISVDWDPEF